MQAATRKSTLQYKQAATQPSTLNCGRNLPWDAWSGAGQRSGGGREGRREWVVGGRGGWVHGHFQIPAEYIHSWVWDLDPFPLASLAEVQAGLLRPFLLFLSPCNLYLIYPPIYTRTCTHSCKSEALTQKSTHSSVCIIILVRSANLLTSLLNTKHSPLLRKTESLL